jgi:hypothetical protein
MAASAGPNPGPVRVPAITGVRIEPVQRQLIARDLRFTFGCLDDVKDAPVSLGRSSPDELAVIVDQCPRAGERVARGTAVSCRAVAWLPGGYRWHTGTLPSNDDVDSSRRPVCANRRDVFSSRHALRP